jgi:WD40 repeat protein
MFLRVCFFNHLRRFKIMLRQYQFATGAVIEVGFRPLERLNSSRVRCSPWTSFGPASIVMGIVTLLGFAAMSTDQSVRQPEAQIWFARASVHGAVDSVVYTDDGKTLASVDSSGHAVLWDVTTGRRSEDQPERFERIRSLAFSPDGRTMVSGGQDSTIILWDMKTLEARSELRAHREAVSALAYSPDGRVLASADGDGKLVLWRTTAGYSRIHEVESPTNISLIRFTPDGAALATSHSNGEVRIRDVASPGESFLVGRYLVPPRGVAFSPDGRTLAVSSKSSSQILLWDVTERRLKGSLTGPTKGTPSLGYSTDGRLLVVLRGNETLQLWDVTAGQGQAAVEWHCTHVWAVAFSRDGLTLASGGNDHCVRLWDVAKLLEPSMGSGPVNVDGVSRWGQVR